MTNPAPTGNTALVRPTVQRKGYLTSEMKDLTSDTLTGAHHYGPKDEDIGGFLGMAEHRIAVPLDQANIVRNKKGDHGRVYGFMSMQPKRS